MINDILDISKIQSGKYTLEKREVQLDEILFACLGSFRITASDAQVAIVNEIDSNLPSIRADGVKLRQIFTNLISNAIKFTPPGGTVTVNTRVLADGRAVCIVKDTGVGMSAEELQIAMVPFGQVDGGKSRWREGTGLGLPIAKSLVELHGGELRVKSEKNGGTEVWVCLPSTHELSIHEARDTILGANPEMATTLRGLSP